jgi:molybdopterin molybdotransferase
MISVEEAQERVLAAVRLLGTERVALTGTLGRVLREDVRATHDIPQGDNTAMDGYAVRAADIAAASGDAPAVLRVIEDLAAGSVATRRLEPGTASRIMTGALMPEGADTVAHVEITDAGLSEVRVYRPLGSSTNVRRRGEDMMRGALVLAAGAPIGPAEVGVLASAQKSMVTVARRPTVAVISTGSEIVDVDAPVELGKVINSNSYSLAALAQAAGAIPRMIGIVPDTLEATIAAIESALESDFLVSSGGVSVGAYDFVKAALDALGAETDFWQVSMKPGKPVVLSQLRNRLYFGLPGNPVSCMVSFHLFVVPALRKAMGERGPLLPPAIGIRLAGALRSRGDRRTYQRVRVATVGGELVAFPMAAQGSGVSTSMVEANGLAIMDEGVARIDEGAEVMTVLIGPIRP